TRFYQDLRWKHRVAPSVYDMPVEYEGTMFMTGKIGMQAGGPWTGLMYITAGVDFDVAPMPIGPNGKRATRVSWDASGMDAQTEHPEEAWRVMRFCAGPEGQAIVGRSLRSIPALVSAKDSFIDPDNGWNEERFVEALEYSELQPITYKWDKMRQIMVKE